MLYKCKLKLIEDSILDELCKSEIRLDYKPKGSIFYNSIYIFKSSIYDDEYRRGGNYTNQYDYFNCRLNEFLELGEKRIMELCKNAIKENEHVNLKENNAIDSYNETKSKAKKLFNSFEIEVK